MLYHIGLEEKFYAKYAILPGDPARAEYIASFFDNPTYLTSNREYTSYLCYLNNEPILIISTGIGGPSCAICVEELYKTGAENFIRIGTCGGMQLDIENGDLIVANSAVRLEGTSKEYLPIEIPAVSDFYLTQALVNACKSNNFKFHVGTVHCKDSFYGQHEPKRMPISYELLNKWDACIKAGVLASEMESASLYAVASTLNVKATCILTVVWNQERANAGLSNDEYHNHTNSINAIKVALQNLIGV